MLKVNNKNGFIEIDSIAVCTKGGSAKFIGNLQYKDYISLLDTCKWLSRFTRCVDINVDGKATIVYIVFVFPDLKNDIKDLHKCF